MFLRISRFYISCFNVFQNSRQMYALHLMNSLLNIFCYVISNVSIRINLHRVWLMTESYPDKQNHSKKPYKGHDMFCPINMGQSSQDSENLSWMLEQSGAYIQAYLKLVPNQRGTLSWAYDYWGHIAHSVHFIKSSRGESFQSPYWQG